MSETQRIVDQLQRAYHGDAWHGPSVRAALEGVDVQRATIRIDPNVHTIAEIVRHITAWTQEVTRRLQIGIAQDPEIGDWAPAKPADEASWRAMIATLDQANDALVKAIAALDDAKLDEKLKDARDPTPGHWVSHYVHLHGLVQHHIYHAGQIAILAKALAQR